MHWEIVDIRDEIAEYEHENRFWPKSGSVSKPYDRNPQMIVGWRWSAEDIARAKGEYEQEQFYKTHHKVLVLGPREQNLRIAGIRGESRNE